MAIYWSLICGESREPSSSLPCNGRLELFAIPLLRLALPMIPCYQPECCEE